MRFVFHLGFPKAGSTSLQASLARSRDELAKKNVLYPTVEAKVSRRHNLLATPFLKKPQRIYNGKTIDGKEPIAAANAAWEKIAIDYDDYDTIVISSEHLSSISDISRFGEFFKNTFPNASAEGVFYLRRPSEHYASLMQQRIKGTHSLDGFYPVDFHAVIKSWAEIFPLTLRELSPLTLHSGSISADFAMVANLGVSLVEVRKNEGLSAEAMQIVQNYRRIFHSKSPHVFTQDTNNLINKLRKIAGPEATKARLKPEIALQADALRFILLLKDDFNFEFSGINYENRDAFSLEPSNICAGENVSDYISVDPEELERLLYSIAMDSSKQRVVD